MKSMRNSQGEDRLQCERNPTIAAEIVGEKVNSIHNDDLDSIVFLISFFKIKK